MVISTFYSLAKYHQWQFETSFRNLFWYREEPRSRASQIGNVAVCCIQEGNSVHARGKQRQFVAYQGRVPELITPGIR